MPVALVVSAAYIVRVCKAGIGILSITKSVSSALFMSLIGVSGSPALSSEPEMTPPYRVNRLFYGCWMKETIHDRKRWPISSADWCFERGRMIYGVTFDAGDGWDYCLRWRVEGQYLLIDDEYNAVRRCRYAFSSDRRTLILTECPSSGEWRRNDERTKLLQGSRYCRPHEQPDFEDNSKAKE